MKYAQTSYKAIYSKTSKPERSQTVQSNKVKLFLLAQDNSGVYISPRGRGHVFIKYRVLPGANVRVRVRRVVVQVPVAETSISTIVPVATKMSYTGTRVHPRL